MLSKLIFFILLGLLLFVLWQKKRVARIRREEPVKKVPEAKKMVQCPICGVHFAEVDGVWMNGKSYCSLACAQKAEDEAHSQH